MMQAIVETCVKVSCPVACEIACFIPDSMQPVAMLAAVQACVRELIGIAIRRIPGIGHLITQIAECKCT